MVGGPVDRVEVEELLTVQDLRREHQFDAPVELPPQGDVAQEQLELARHQQASPEAQQTITGIHETHVYFFEPYGWGVGSHAPVSVSVSSLH